MTRGPWRFGRELLAGLLLVGTLAAAGAEANKDWFMRAWQSDDGLPENIVTGVVQTPDGFLWVATPSGLAWFDGTHFEVYSHTNFPGVPNSHVRLLLASRAGGLWLAMDRGPVVNVTKGKTHVFTRKDGLSSLHAQIAVEDDLGALWIAYNNGSIHRLQAGKATDFSDLHGMPPGEICSLAKDSRGTIWMCRGGQLGVLHGERFQPLQKTGSELTGIAFRESGGVWVCADTRLMYCEEGGELVEQGELKVGHSIAKLPVLLDDHHGGVWIGTSTSGLIHYNGKQFESIFTSHNEINALTEDREGNLWVGTSGGGLNRIRPRALQLEGSETGLPSPIVQSLCEDTHGMLWAAMQNGLLARRTVSGWSLVSTNEGWRGGAATCVAAAPDGTVWIGTPEHGVYRWRNGQFSPLEMSEGLRSSNVREMLAGKTGDIWIAFGGLLNKVVMRWHDGHSTQMLLPYGKNVGAMAMDAAGNLWVATLSGNLLRAGNEGLVDETMLIGPDRLRIRCLQTTADGSLWIGYDDAGLGRLKEGRFARITVAQKLPNNHISQIVEDGRGRLWFGANCGIFCVREDELDAVAEGRASSVIPARHGADEGFPNLQASVGQSPNVLRSRDGRLWMPMCTGLAVVNPDKLRNEAAGLPALIERVTVDGNVMGEYSGTMPVPSRPVVINLRMPDANLRLAPSHRRVDFDFTALNLAAPETVHFRYRLDGLDTDWIEAPTQRRASYSRLSPGNYRFRVEGSNDGRTWNESGATLALEAMPYLWETLWFQLGSLGLVVCAVALVAKRVLSIRHRREIERLEQVGVLDRERTRIAQDLHDDLGAGLAQIGLLGSIVQRSSVSTERTQDHVRKMTTTTREMVNALDEIVWAINPRHDSITSLSDYLCAYAQEFLQAAAIRCRLDVAEKLSSDILNTHQRHNLFLAFKEVLTNAVLHSEASEVWIRISTADGRLQVTVEDNGKGLTPQPVAPGADGLTNMSRRLNGLNGRCEIEGAPGGGTRVRFVLPLGRKEKLA